MTAKPGFNGKGGSPMYGGKCDEPGMHLTSGRDAGGPVAPSAGLEPLSSEALFKNAGPPVPPDVCVVPVAGMRPQQHRVVSLEPMPTFEHQRQHQQQHLVTVQQQQQPQQPFRMNGGQQWDDVVRGMTTPQGSGHSLDLGSVDLSSNGSRGSNSNAIKAEFEPLLAPTNSGGNWNSNDSGGALLGPMPPPQPVQPPLRGWSFDSAQIGDASQFSSGNMVMDLSDMDNLFRSTEGEAGGTAGNGSNGSSGSSADAGAGARQQQQQDIYVPSKWPVPEGVLPLEKVIIEPSRKVGGLPGAADWVVCARERSVESIGCMSIVVFLLFPWRHDFACVALLFRRLGTRPLLLLLLLMFCSLSNPSPLRPPQK